MIRTQRDFALSSHYSRFQRRALRTWTITFAKRALGCWNFRNDQKTLNPMKMLLFSLTICSALVLLVGASTPTPNPPKDVIVNGTTYKSDSEGHNTHLPNVKVEAFRKGGPVKPEATLSHADGRVQLDTPTSFQRISETHILLRLAVVGFGVCPSKVA
jgi:hypothetical protein